MLLGREAILGRGPTRALKQEEQPRDQVNEMLLLPRLLRGRGRPEYAAVQAMLEGDSTESTDLHSALWILVVLISLKLLVNSLFLGPVQRLAQRRGKDVHHRDGRKLLEELWVLTGNVGMLALACAVMLRSNGGCWWGDTSPCLAGWPAHAIARPVHWYYSAELAWYLHLLLKPVLRYGVPDGRDMVLHHCATLALVVSSLGLNLTRFGVLVLSLFALSNPLLHLAKIANQLDLPLRTPAFGAFALAFFVTRVIMVPRVILKPAILDSRTLVPHAVADFPALYCAITGLLVALYALNLSWMLSIARVLGQAATQGGDAASRLSAKVDPAQRYGREKSPPPGLHRRAAASRHADGQD